MSSQRSVGIRKNKTQSGEQNQEHSHAALLCQCWGAQHSRARGDTETNEGWQMQDCCYFKSKYSRAQTVKDLTDVNFVKVNKSRAVNRKSSLILSSNIKNLYN